MKLRKFGKTPWNVSEIGFGAWGIGKNWWGTTDDVNSIEALEKAWELGVNFFDTAYVYGDGHSEQIISKVLHGKDAIIATKIPPKNSEWPGNPKSDVNNVFPKDWIISCTERSLKYLKRDALDLTQLHVWCDEWLNQGEWMETIAMLKKQGKIKAFGVSINDHQPNSALKLVESGLVDSIQVIFNIFDQSPTEKLFPLCKKHNVAVIARVPLDEGGLTGTLTYNTKFEEGDFRKQYFQGNNLKQTVDHVEKLKKLLGSEAKTMPELALKFILGHDAVSTVIPGMRNKKHVILNTAIADQPPLSDSLMKELKNHAWPRNFYGWWE